MSTVIYLVTSGEYSDYGVHAAFSMKEGAEAFVAAEKAKHTWPEQYYIERYALDDPNAEGLTDAPLRWSVTMYRDGDGAQASPERFNNEDEGDESQFSGPYGWATDYGPAGTRFFHWAGWSHSKEQAIKAANERRVQLLAQEEA